MKDNLFGGEPTERKCPECGWTGIPALSQVGEFETLLCPHLHIIDYVKNKGEVTKQKKSSAKVDKKKENRTKIIESMDGFQIGRNPELTLAINEVYHENNLVTFSRMDDDILDMIMTSPPYDKLRDYEGVEWDYKKVMLEAHRTLKPGGVMVWNVDDQTTQTGRTGNSLRHALFAQDIGFYIHDYMIYKKKSPAYPSSEKSKRYTRVFEFVWILSKGDPKTVNLIIDKVNKTAGEITKNGKQVKEMAPRENIWEYGTGKIDTQKDKIATLHPAIFPELFAADHIKSWSNEGDLVYEPFGGSGTTAKVSQALKRRFIISEITAKYIKIIKERLNTLDL